MANLAAYFDKPISFAVIRNLARLLLLTERVRWWSVRNEVVVCVGNLIGSSRAPTRRGRDIDLFRFRPDFGRAAKPERQTAGHAHSRQGAEQTIRIEKGVRPSEAGRHWT